MSVQPLIDYYRALPWYGKIFFPRKLARVLISPNVSFIRLNQVIKTLPFYAYLYKPIRNFYNTIHRSYLVLEEAVDCFEDIVLQNTCEALENKCKTLVQWDVRYKRNAMGQLIRDYAHSTQLTHEDAESVILQIIQHPYCYALLEVVNHYIAHTHLLSQENAHNNWLKIIQNQSMRENHSGFPVASRSLTAASLLSDMNHAQSNFEQIVALRMTHGGDFYNIFFLENHQILFSQDAPERQAIFELLVQHDEAYQIARILITLIQLELYHPDLHPHLAQKKSFYEKNVCQILVDLKEMGFLVGAEAQAICLKVLNDTPRPYHIETIVRYLKSFEQTPLFKTHKKQLLDTILSHDRPYGIEDTLNYLKRKDQLSIETFVLVCHYLYWQNDLPIPLIDYFLMIKKETSLFDDHSTEETYQLIVLLVQWFDDQLVKTTAILSAAKILNRSTILSLFDMIKMHREDITYPNIHTVISLLHQNGRLSEESFNRIWINNKLHSIENGMINMVRTCVDHDVLNCTNAVEWALRYLRQEIFWLLVPRPVKILCLDRINFNSFSARVMAQFLIHVPQQITELKMAHCRLGLVEQDDLIENLFHIPKSITSLNISDNHLQLISIETLNALRGMLDQVHYVWCSEREMRAMSPDQRIAFEAIFPNLKTLVITNEEGLPCEMNPIAQVNLAKRIGFINPEIPSLSKLCAFFIKKEHVELDSQDTYLRSLLK